MKRILMWLLVLVLLLCGCELLNACVPKDVPRSIHDLPSVSTAADPDVPSAPTQKEETPGQESMSSPPVNALPPEGMMSPAAEPAPEKITYTVERDTRQEEISTEDNVKLAAVRYQLPLLQAYSADGAPITEGTTAERSRALEVTAAFNEKFDPWRLEDGTLRREVTEDYAYRPDMFKMGMYYVDELDFSIWQTERLVSIRADSYSYYGGAHPNIMLFGWNFDLVSGTYINALSIGHDEQEFRTLVADELIVQADERAAALQQEPTAMYWQDYRNILLNWSDYPVFFDTAGMTVRFSAYELGSYAAGPHEFTLSYAFLEPYLGDYGRDLLGVTPTA